MPLYKQIKSYQFVSGRRKTSKARHKLFAFFEIFDFSISVGVEAKRKGDLRSSLFIIQGTVLSSYVIRETFK